MKPLNSLLLIVLIYLSIQAMGLYVGFGLIGLIETGEVQPVVQNPESVESSVHIFLYILVMTGVLLVLLKYRLSIIIKIMLVLAMLMGTSITLSSFIGYPGAFVSLLLVVITFLRKNIMVTNLTLVFTISGIGAWLGASLAVLPALILLIALSIYDIVAVFGTKHMVKLAEMSKGNLPLMFLIPVKDRHLGLGTGDLVIPLTFTVSVLRDYTLGSAVVTAFGGLLGLISLFIYVLHKEKVTLPALPPLTLGLIFGFLVSFIL